MDNLFNLNDTDNLKLFLWLRSTQESAILNTDSTYQTMQIQIRKQIQKLHNYKITPPASAGGRWQTWYRDETGKLINIKAPTEEKLYDKLAGFYCGEHLDKMTFHNVFNEWIEYKKSVTGSINTILRHKQHYTKYFGRLPIDTKSFRHIDIITLETTCNELIRVHNLSSKEWCNVKTILNGMYVYSVRKGYCKANLVPEVRITVRFRQINKKSGKSQTYNTEELQKLNEYLDKRYVETGDASLLAVKLNFLLGLRVGELVALQWSDLEGNRLHVVREEVRDQVANKYFIEDHTKTHSDRYVILVPQALSIIQSISKNGPYIFTRKGKRITSRQIAYVLQKYAQVMGTDVKMTHKMRKTYASNLATKGVPIDAIREQLGHSNLKTTLGYIYNPLTDDETYRLISEALC